jgi:hypothetical protein
MAAALTERDRRALLALAELRLPVQAHFVMQCPTTYAALEMRALVASADGGRWQITDAGRRALAGSDVVSVTSKWLNGPSPFGKFDDSTRLMVHQPISGIEKLPLARRVFRHKDK